MTRPVQRGEAPQRIPPSSKPSGLIAKIKGIWERIKSYFSSESAPTRTTSRFIEANTQVISTAQDTAEKAINSIETQISLFLGDSTKSPTGTAHGFLSDDALLAIKKDPRYVEITARMSIIKSSLNQKPPAERQKLLNELATLQTEKLGIIKEKADLEDLNRISAIVRSDDNMLIETVGESEGLQDKIQTSLTKADRHFQLNKQIEDAYKTIL